MLNNKNGYSLSVLIIIIAVILIITTTAVMSIKGIDKDKEISKFMSDLEEVKQYTIEYLAKNNILPVLYEDGDMKSAEDELIAVLSSGEALSQLDEEDVGDYYYVDISKLGKMHLDNYDRGYIVNEGTLNVYVTTPCVYQGVSYYTLTPELIGKDIVEKESTPFEINVMGNPVTWSERADILVSVPNVKVGEAEGWNFKWLKGSKTSSDFRDDSGNRINFFTYGEVITWEENGIYTIYVENPEKQGRVRKVAVSKIDDLPPTIKYNSGELFIDDAETGVKSIRCKIKENINYKISQSARNAHPEYYTKFDETHSESQEDLLNSYLWSGENIKGDTVATYLRKYSEYYERYTQYNNILNSNDSTSGEVENARSMLENLNDEYPQFAYNGKKFSDTERNIVLYVEDIVGNGAIYSAVSRDELVSLQYISGDITTLFDSRVVINDNSVYTNNPNVKLYLQSIYATDVFVTETRGASASWEEFDGETMNYRLSSGDGEKTVYAFFKDATGKTKGVYDQINLDTTKPTSTEPTVNYSGDKILSIVNNQTDTRIVDGKETQSGIDHVYYGVKEGDDADYVWYTNVNLIPKLRKGITYKFVTRAIDKVGNEQISRETILKVAEEQYEISKLKVGDYVDYKPENKTYTTNTDNTGYTSSQELATVDKAWRVFSINSTTGEVLITTDGIANDGVYLSNKIGYLYGIQELNNICKTLYSNSDLELYARCMNVNDLNKVCNYTPVITKRYAYYPFGSSVSGTVENLGNMYTRVAHGYAIQKFYTSDAGGKSISEGGRYVYKEPETSNPVYVTGTYYDYSPSAYNNVSSKILGTKSAWLASSCVAVYDTYADFCVFDVYEDYLGAANLDNSSNYPNSFPRGIHPVITLNSDFCIDASDSTKDGSSEPKAWKIIRNQ